MPGQGIADGDEDALALERLLEKVGGAAPRALDGGGDVAVARDHQNRRRSLARDDPVQGLEAVHPGHLDVEQHGRGRGAVEIGKRRAAVSHRRHLVALVLEDHAEGVADGGFVVDDQDSL